MARGFPGRQNSRETIAGSSRQPLKEDGAGYNRRGGLLGRLVGRIISEPVLRNNDSGLQCWPPSEVRDEAVELVPASVGVRGKADHLSAEGISSVFAEMDRQLAELRRGSALTAGRNRPPVSATSGRAGDGGRR